MNIKPGDTHRWGDKYEAVAEADVNNETGCDHCIGALHSSICETLPAGCNNSYVIWKPNNEATCLLVVTYKFKLEGVEHAQTRPGQETTPTSR
jgi:hypothetical protein